VSCVPCVVSCLSYAHRRCAVTGRIR
jgi:hypothetical protein